MDVFIVKSDWKVREREGMTFSKGINMLNAARCSKESVLRVLHVLPYESPSPYYKHIVSIQMLSGRWQLDDNVFIPVSLGVSSLTSWPRKSL